MSRNVSALTRLVVRFKTTRFHCGSAAALLAIFLLAPWVQGEAPPLTPLEVAKYGRLSTSAEISAYLNRLARMYPQARVDTLGATVQGRPIEALLLTAVPGADVTTHDRLTIEIVG